MKPKITSLSQRAFIDATPRDLAAFYSLLWGIFHGNDATDKQTVVMTNSQAVIAQVFSPYDRSDGEGQINSFFHSSLMKISRVVYVVGKNKTLIP